MDQFQLGVYCGVLSMAFCYFLVFGPHILALGSVMFLLTLAHEADLNQKGSRVSRRSE